MIARRVLVALLNTGREIANAARMVADGRSFGIYAADIVLYRVLHVARLPWENRERRIRLRGGVEVAYRLNRGDIQTIREVWIDELYRLPFETTLRTIVDLGAHVGLTSLWLAKRYGESARVIAVEASPANAHLARLNLQRNGVGGEVVNAAVYGVGAPGRVLFRQARDSNLGAVGCDGSFDVEVTSMPRILERLPAETVVDLVKVDIEGAEASLFAGDCSWLDRVAALIIEFHPDRVDRRALAQVIERMGFEYLPAGSVSEKSMDVFVKAR